MAVDFKSESEVKEYIKNLGIEYRFGCFSEKNPEVCHLLADYLEAIKKDYEKAGKVYKNNCDDYKYHKSCLKYGTYALLGRGLKEADYKAGYSYFEKGCKLNNTECCLNQGLLLITNNVQFGLQQDVLKGMELLEKACSAQNGNACYYLSGMYIAGVRKIVEPVVPESKLKPEDYVVQKNMEKAFKYALSGCDLDNFYSCVNLSRMYAKGDGVKQNSELAAKYRKKAEEMQSDIQSNKTLTFQQGLD